MLCVSLKIAQEVKPIRIGRLHLGWLEPHTMAVCSMKHVPQLSWIHHMQSYFRASPPFFTPSVAAQFMPRKAKQETLPTPQETATLNSLSLPSVFHRQV